jgi:hypothetical protein
VRANRLAEIQKGEEEGSTARSQMSSALPSLRYILAEEEHEVSARRRRARRKRAVDSASKVRRSRRLAAKEDPFYVDATTEASHVKAAKLDLDRASEHLKAALEASGVLERPPPARIPLPGCASRDVSVAFPTSLRLMRTRR